MTTVKIQKWGLKIAVIHSHPLPSLIKTKHDQKEQTDKILLIYELTNLFRLFFLLFSLENETSPLLFYDFFQTNIGCLRKKCGNVRDVLQTFSAHCDFEGGTKL